MINFSQENQQSQSAQFSSKKSPEKRFFVVMAWVFCGIAVTGFAPSYQAAYKGTFQFHWFVHVHGAFMAAWFGVFLVQTTLVKNRNLRLHKQLGLYSVALGVLVWLSMGIVSYRVLIGYPPHVHHLSEVMWPALWVQLSAMNLFGLFFTWAMVQRNNAGLHKRLLYLSMLVLLQAAFGRITWLPWYGEDHPNVFFFYLDLLLIPLAVFDYTSNRRIQKVTIIGSLSIIAVQLVTISF
jgi:hypothetical protein